MSARKRPCRRVLHGTVGLATLCLFACNAGVRHEVAWPEFAPQTRTLFVAMIDLDVLRLQVRDVADAKPFQVAFGDESTARARVVVLESSEDLETLGLVAGEVEPAVPGACFVRALPSGGRIHELEFGSMGWQELAELGSPLTEYQLKVKCPCRDLQIDRVYELAAEPGGGRLRTVLRGDELFAFTVSQAFRLDLTKTSTGQSISDEFPWLVGDLEDAWLDDEDWMWHVSTHSLTRWRPGAPREVIFDASPAPWCQTRAKCLAGAAVMSRGESYEAFIVDRFGGVYRATESSFGQLAISLVERDTSQEGRAARVQSGHFVFALHDDLALARYKDGQLSTASGPGSIQAMRMTRFGLLAGSYDSEIYQIDPETLEAKQILAAEGRSVIGIDWIEAIASDEDRAVAVAHDGSFAEIYPGLGLCPAYSDFEFVQGRSIATHNGQVVVSGHGRDDHHRVVVWGAR